MVYEINTHMYICIYTYLKNKYISHLTQ